jgi:Zn-dependent protease with chaperone function
MLTKIGVALSVVVIAAGVAYATQAEGAAWVNNLAAFWCASAALVMIWVGVGIATLVQNSIRRRSETP